MSEELLIRHCSPTLAGMKTANMFVCKFADATAMRESLRRYNKLLGKKGLRLLPLRFEKGRALIYVYRPSHLSRDLEHCTAARILSERGYCSVTPSRCLAELMKRLEKSGEFPHEIGLFLGYPPEDVCGFIENRDCFKCVGTWKVYGDAETAEKTFAKYKKCTRVYCEQHAKGRPIERLTVAM